MSELRGYRELRESAAWIDRGARGKIRVRGEDRARLLHAMTTNHIEELTPGRGCYAFFLNAQGRILGDVNVLTLPDHFLLDTEPETKDMLYAHLDKYIIADDVTLEDATAELATLGIEGPKASGVLASLGAPVPVEPYCHADWDARIVTRIDSTGAGGFTLFAPASEMQELARALERAGGDVVSFGAPVDPGNLLLVGRLGTVSVLGAPGCARSPRENVIDAVLPRLLAGDSLTREDVVALGHGGLLEDVPERGAPR